MQKLATRSIFIARVRLIIIIMLCVAQQRDFVHLESHPAECHPEFLYHYGKELSSGYRMRCCILKRIVNERAEDMEFLFEIILNLIPYQLTQPMSET